jgi:hypothetical protein
MSPSFRRRTSSLGLDLIRIYNEEDDSDDDADDDSDEDPDEVAGYETLLPLVLSLEPAREDQGLLANWKPVISIMKRMWLSSSSHRLFHHKFKEADRTTVKITKIVCFGLGALQVHGKGEYWHSVNAILQHIVAISIAHTLWYLHRDEPFIPIICQDPEYTTTDHEIWRAHYSNIRFVDEPHGFLAVDKHTLVISAFLPFDVPMVQIVADQVPGGPAGLITNKMDLDRKKRMYCMGDRASPKVVNMLLDGYERSNFDHHEIFKEYPADLCYWLWDMECFLKRKRVPELESEADPI